MKKMLALVLALLLALGGAAFAEEFSFRGVVGWNSTQEEIMTAFAE